MYIHRRNRELSQSSEKMRRLNQTNEQTNREPSAANGVKTLGPVFEARVHSHQPARYRFASFAFDSTNRARQIAPDVFSRFDYYRNGNWKINGARRARERAQITRPINPDHFLRPRVAFHAAEISIRGVHSTRGGNTRGCRAVKQLARHPRSDSEPI